MACYVFRVWRVLWHDFFSFIKRLVLKRFRAAASWLKTEWKHASDIIMFERGLNKNEIRGCHRTWLCYNYNHDEVISYLPYMFGRIFSFLLSIPTNCMNNVVGLILSRVTGCHGKFVVNWLKNLEKLNGIFILNLNKTLMRQHRTDIIFQGAEEQRKTRRIRRGIKVNNAQLRSTTLGTK